MNEKKRVHDVGAEASSVDVGPNSPRHQSLIDRVMGPHEWGYRDLTDGAFIQDNAPFLLAESLLRIRQPPPRRSGEGWIAYQWRCVRWWWAH